MNLTDFNDAIIIKGITEPITPIHAIDLKKVMVFQKSGLSRSDLLLDGKEYNPTPKDRLYFYPGCSILRHKVREWGKTDNITITRHQDKATAEFIAMNTLKQMFTDQYITKVSKDMFIEFLTLNYPEDNFELQIDEIRNTVSDFVYLDIGWDIQQWLLFDSQNNNNNGKNRAKEVGITISLKDLWRKYNLNAAKHDQIHRGFTAWMDDKTFDQLTHLFNSTKVYTQESLIQHINKGATIIDNGMYMQLNNMLASNNKEDIIVAMECMANCNLDRSLGKILLLLKNHYGSAIHSRKEKNHVNFKSLLTFINMPGLNWITYDNIIDNMMDKGLLDKQTLEELMPLVKHDMKKNHDTGHFKINTITVSNEVKRYFGATTTEPDPIVDEEE